MHPRSNTVIGLIEPHTSSGKRSLHIAIYIAIFTIVCFHSVILLAQNSSETWRAASDAELKALLPARAPVEKEHIETEMRTASGITNGHEKFFAGVVLITAGYSADGKYSHFLITQVPLQVGDLFLSPGEYVIGWQRGDAVLNVHFYDAANGKPRGSVEARIIPGNTRVESFKIWPPQQKSLIQIGRFGIPFRLTR